MAKSLIASAALLLASTAHAAPAVDPLHGWVSGTPEGLKGWTQGWLDEEKAAIAAIKAVKGERTIANTLEPFDRAQNALTIASSQTGVLYQVADTAPMRDAGQALAQLVSTANTQLNLDREVYDALIALAATPEARAADPATRHYLERTLLEYRLAGVDRDAAVRAKIQQLQDKITALGLTFGRNVQDGTQKVQTSAGHLAGLPADYIARHQPGPDGVVTLTTEQPDVAPVLKFASDAGLRRQMVLAYGNRAYPANQQVLKDLLIARQELATTLGFASWADFAVADQMMGSTKALHQFLEQLDAVSRPIAAREMEALNAFAAKTDPAAMPLTEADASYWLEQYRRAHFDFNSQSARPYFPYAQVEAGILDVAARLFHLRFVPAKDVVVWGPGVAAFDVYDAQAGGKGQKLGRIFLDMHPREGKDKWFSAGTITPGIAGRQLPEGLLICNFPGGMAGDPGLMEYGDVVTFFHEFGHLMHHILGGQGRWSGQGGFNVEGDFVEAPSQMLEELFHNPAVLQSFAKHYQTGEVLPAAMITKMNRADAYGRGYWMQRQLQFASYSLDVHDRPPEQIDLQRLYQDDQRRFSPFVPLADAHSFASFTHLTAYASNYYTYLLDKVIAVDFYEQFDAADPLGGPAALRYRHKVLEPGASVPASDLVKGFLGRPQNVDALSRWMKVQFIP